MSSQKYILIIKGYCNLIFYKIKSFKEKLDLPMMLCLNFRYHVVLNYLRVLKKPSR